MKQINWRRGIFRLWLVLSILWLGLITTLDLQHWAGLADFSSFAKLPPLPPGFVLEFNSSHWWEKDPIVSPQNSDQKTFAVRMPGVDRTFTMQAETLDSLNRQITSYDYQVRAQTIVVHAH